MVDITLTKDTRKGLINSTFIKDDFLMRKCNDEIKEVKTHLLYH